MLFRKKHPRLCEYCKFAAEAEPGWRICMKKGIVRADHRCLRFRYDPLQRKPKHAKALDFSKYDKTDFSL